MKKYQDITAIIKKKDEYRRALAALSFEKKIEMVFRIQKRREFIKSGRAENNSRKNNK